MLNVKSSLHVLGNSPLSDMSFVDTFFESMNCSILLVTLSFAKQKLSF